MILHYLFNYFALLINLFVYLCIKPKTHWPFNGPEKKGDHYFLYFALFVYFIIINNILYYLFILNYLFI